MSEAFGLLLAVGGKSNSLGRSSEVVEAVLRDKSRLSELYDCLFDQDAWTRMRAADALEKVCRLQPEWLLPYIDKLGHDLTASQQPAIQWHLAQIYRQVRLSPEQKHFVIDWLTRLLSSTEVDWIVASNAMDTLSKFRQDGIVSTSSLAALLEIQRQHRSKTVVRRAEKLLSQLPSH